VPSRFRPLPPRVGRPAARHLRQASAGTLRKELLRLDSELGDDERVVGLLAACPPYVWLGLLVLTTERVLYLRKRVLRGFDIRRIPLAAIETVETEPGSAGMTMLTLESQPNRADRFGLLPKNQDITGFLRDLKTLAGSVPNS
jgi:hypothetical protein